MLQTLAIVVAIAVLGMFFTGHIRPADIPSLTSFSEQNFVYLLVLPYIALMGMIFRLDR